MKKNLLPILILFASQQFVSAQVPGYQGKRFSVYYNISAFPRIQEPGYADDLRVINMKRINLTQNFAADYTISCDAAAGISFRSFKTGINIYQIDTVKLQNFYTSAINEYAFNMRSKWYGVYYKKFYYHSTGCIAPVGNYQKFEVALGFNKLLNGKVLVTDEMQFTNGTNYVAPPADSVNILKKAVTFGLFYTLGSQHVFARRFIFNPSVQIGINPSALYRMYTYFDGTSPSVYLWDGWIAQNSVAFHRAMKVRIQSYFMMSVNIGLGVLLF